MTSYFAEPEFAERFALSRQETAAATASRIIEVAGIEPGQLVVDLCCGPGLVSRHLAERVGASGSVIGVDESAAMVELARRNVTAANARFVEGDAYDLPSLVTAPVDVVVATSAWQNFLFDKQRIIQAVRRVLKLSGRFAFDVRLREPAGTDASRPAPLAGYRERVMTLVREAYPDVALVERSEITPFGLRAADRQRYIAHDIERDIALMEANGLRLVTRREISGPDTGRQRWRVDYWLSRTAPALTPVARAKVLDQVAAEVRSRRSGTPRQRVTTYVVMEVAPLS